MRLSFSLVPACSALLITACTPELVDDDAAFLEDAVDAFAPPPAPMPAGANAFVVGELDAGLNTRFTWADLPAGAVVQVYVSPNGVGAGPCPARFQGDCLDIEGPVSLIGTARANRPGVATGLFPVPARQAQGTYTFQAVAYTPATGYLFSEPYERSTGFQFCPFTYLPVCGVNHVIYDNDCMAEIAGTAVRSLWSCP